MKFHLVRRWPYFGYDLHLKFHLSMKFRGLFELEGKGFLVQCLQGKN